MESKSTTSESGMIPSHSTCTLTFGDCAENHVGMEKVGTRAAAGEGFTFAEMSAMRRAFPGTERIVYDLPSAAGLAGVEPARVLVIKGGINHIFGAGYSKAMLEEQCGLEMDKKALMYKRVVNKKARWNLCFTDGEGHEPAYEEGKGRVVSYDDVPLLKGLVGRLPELFGEKARDLQGEANYYYDVSKCGIGYHGDTERRKVIAVRLGAAMPLVFQWYHRFKKVGPRIDIPLEDGDIYVMSEKAVGCDWKSSSKYTLRHAAGCAEYTD